jgi:tetratricopeptide (TPR) repeat protein
MIFIMAIQVRERTIEEIQDKLGEMSTALNKIGYLESALNIAGLSFEIKRFLWEELSGLYQERKMFERAARAMANKAGMEVTFRDKIDSYITAAELFARIGKVDDADDMFVRASRDANTEQKSKVRLARKNIYSVSAKELESKGKKASAVKFYEKLIKMNLEDVEKVEIKEKLLATYKALGMFREAKLLAGL